MPTLAKKLNTRLHTELEQTGGEFRMFILDKAADEAEKEGRDVIRLTLGKSDLPLHPAIEERMIQSLGDRRIANLVFPTGLPALKESLAAHYARVHNISIPTARILIDAGTSSIFRNLFLLLLEPNDEVLLPLPYYPLYKVSAVIARARIRYYSINPKTSELDVESFEANFNSATRVVVINSPGNPLGNVITVAVLERLLKIIGDRSTVVFDEIYDNMSFGPDQSSLVPTLWTAAAAGGPDVILTNSFSKGYRMYCRRVGWCVLSERLVSPMTVMLHHTRLTVDPVAQYGGVEALNHPDELERVRSIHCARRDYTYEVLRHVNGIQVYPSNGGFYCTIDCRQHMNLCGVDSDLALAMDILSDCDVATVPGEDFGIPGTLRLSFTAGRYNEAIDRLREYFQSA